MVAKAKKPAKSSVVQELRLTDLLKEHNEKVRRLASIFNKFRKSAQCTRQWKMQVHKARREWANAKDKMEAAASRCP